MDLYRAAFGLMLLLVGCGSPVVTELAQPDLVSVARAWYEEASPQKDTGKIGDLKYDPSPRVERLAPDWSTSATLLRKGVGGYVTTVLGEALAASFGSRDCSMDASQWIGVT